MAYSLLLFISAEVYGQLDRRSYPYVRTPFLRSSLAIYEYYNTSPPQKTQGKKKTAAMASSYSVAPVQSELKMTLYNKEVYSGRGINGVTTLVNGGPIGTTCGL
jgi:hypothetical protein